MPESAPVLALFSPCPRGLEEALVAELTELGLSYVSALAGGVRYAGGWSDVHRVNLYSRIASRVLLRVAEGNYRTDEDVYRLANMQKWDQWFTPDDTIRVDVTATHSPLRSLEFVTLRIKDGVCDRFRSDHGRRPDVDTRAPAVRIFGFLDERRCTIYIDTSGEALFKRGWRTETVEAPLRENLAAGILRLAGWSPELALVDPMCGSGTFAVEAAQIALGIPPGIKRGFGFERLIPHDASLWNGLRETALSAMAATPAHPLSIHASDVSGDAVVLTRANLVRAGVSEEMAIEIAPKQIDARHIRAPAAHGIMVVNPPYGERIGVRGAELADEFFKEFGDTLKQRFSGWECNILTSDMAFQKKLKLAPRRRTPLFNGAIECRLYKFELVTGSNRPTAKGDAAVRDGVPD